MFRRLICTYQWDWQRSVFRNPDIIFLGELNLVTQRRFRPPHPVRVSLSAVTPQNTKYKKKKYNPKGFFFYFLGCTIFTSQA